MTNKQLIDKIKRGMENGQERYIHQPLKLDCMNGKESLIDNYTNIIAEAIAEEIEKWLTNVNGTVVNITD